MNILDKLEDLYKQATVERSHYYTGSVIKEAHDEITRLKQGRMHFFELCQEQANRIKILADALLLAEKSLATMYVSVMSEADIEALKAVHAALATAAVRVTTPREEKP